MAENGTSVYLPDDLREWVATEAAADRRSVSGYIVLVLEQHRAATAAKGAKS